MVWYGMVNVDLYSASSQKSLMRWVCHGWQKSCDLQNNVINDYLGWPLRLNFSYWKRRKVQRLSPTNPIQTVRSRASF